MTSSRRCRRDLGCQGGGLGAVDEDRGESGPGGGGRSSGCGRVRLSSVGSPTHAGRRREADSAPYRSHQAGVRLMKPLTLKDVLPLEEYERDRDSFRQRIINLKQWRRISVGDRITLVFENRDTVLFQIQEMVRAERILAPERIREELESYNEQIPGTGEMSATLLL